MGDVIKGRNVKEAVKEHTRNAAGNLVGKAGSYIRQQRSGLGYRNPTIKKTKPVKRKKQTKKRGAHLIMKLVSCAKRRPTFNNDVGVLREAPSDQDLQSSVKRFAKFCKYRKNSKDLQRSANDRQRSTKAVKICKVAKDPARSAKISLQRSAEDPRCSAEIHKSCKDLQSYATDPAISAKLCNDLRRSANIARSAKICKDQLTTGKHPYPLPDHNVGVLRDSAFRQTRALPSH